VSEPESAADLPDEIAGYRIDRVLGTGGMSVVYLARNPILPRREALKVLSAELADIPTAGERFLKEAITTSTLDHPNIVKVFSRGEDEHGRPWISMEYIAGSDAETALRHGTMTPSRAMQIITEVARALDYAHLSGVVHQDIKPANFLLGQRSGAEQERVVLADFGAAVTLTETLEREPGGALVASFAYTSPEVITGTAPIDGRADVYSLGCTLFRLLTGSVTFPGHSTAAAIAHAHLEQVAPRPSDLLPWASPELDEVMAKALAKRPADRYATAGEFAAAAARALRSPRRPPRAELPAPPPRVSVTPVESHWLSRRSKRAMIAGGSAAAVLVAVVLAWLVLPSRDDSPAAVSDPTTTTTTSTPAPSSLTRVLPGGYPPGTCTPGDTVDPATEVVMTCRPNQDPGGPVSGTYARVRDAQSLQAALARVIGTATTVVCPGNIQSPGPWRKLAQPDVIQGTVFCGIRDGRPLIAWTLDAERLLAVVESASLDGPGLGDLYAWWASHS
jgi:serine/threonine protein kinase